MQKLIISEYDDEFKLSLLMIEFDQLCQFSQSSFCQIKLSIILVSCKIGQKHPPFIVKVAYCETDTQWENGNGQCQKLLNCQFFCFVMKRDNLN